jgi:hypothetical protein
MNQITLELAFKQWWETSYGQPPSTDTVLTHVAFVEYMLQLMELMQDG